MKRLFIDLEKCSSCPQCEVKCAYFYHSQNNGITSLREYATFVLLCRHCEEAPCINSCYRNALKRDATGHLNRSNMLCTSCKTCSIACPFGVILPEVIPYLNSECDFCLRFKDKIPQCVSSCPYNALEFKEVEEDLINDIYLINENLAVHSRRWTKEDLQSKKR